VKRSNISPLFCAVVRRHPAAVRGFRWILLPLVFLSTFNSQLSTCSAQGTAFMYQGRLNDSGSPANGNYDLRFRVYDAVTDGNPVSLALTNSPTAVSNGLFAVNLDFGPGIFTGLNRWLDIGVRTNGSTSAFIILSPRQLLTPVPYAIFANTASNLSGSLPSSQLAGTLPASAFAGYTNTVSLTNSGNLFGGTFSGNGGGVTNVNVTNLTGVLADNQLPSNTAFVNSNQTFSGANTFTGTNFFSGANNFTNRGNSFVGSFFGNGLVGWIPTNGTALQADIDHGYLVTNSQLTTVTLPASPTSGDIVRISGAGAGGWQVAQNANQAILGNFLGFTNSSWTASTASKILSWYDIASSADGTKMVAVASGDTIYTSADSGKTWYSTSASPAAWRAVASSADGSKLVAALNMGDIYLSTNSGSTWASSGAQHLAWTSLASSADGTRLVATVNNNGGIYTWTSSSGSWSPTSAQSANWSSVASSADGTRLAAAGGSGIFLSSNSGGSWSSSTSGSWSAIASSADGTKLVAAGSSGIYTWTSSGGSWVHRTSGLPGSATWTSVSSSSDGGKLAATASSGGIYTSLNWGATWTQQFGAPSANWSAITSSADGSKLAAVINSATSGGIYTLQASAVSLTTIGTSGGITGGQGTAVELQYIGNNLFMPVSSMGIIWGY
jgi:photosystem II stability/assembly factor-like uncharacterized protein